MYILGVTSCPVGIAHTYMAAANIEKSVQQKGHEVKVETQGATGIENEITQEDLERADAVIIASDVRIKGVERFDSLPTLNVSVTEVVKDANDIVDELLEAIQNG